ncbi:hypothetical protein [Lichenifustis flavocetrariae]|uniref:Uncharacterized protein n=1 Tax=Lichenifustis flavocetrariae TaxID=2949735 RepID=A0AA41Z569_9HYPH|nr:hypothetical protein [Lichenifustis flavocetrariae]MCW6513168.1 hypothetical protein [Lichenifustis flavocetrariae]
MIEGDRVKLKANAPLRLTHPELKDTIGTVGSILTGQGGTLLHVRFDKPANLVVLSAMVEQFEAADRIEPRLRIA